MSSISPSYLDLKGLAAYSSSAVPTLRNYLKSGEIPHFKLKGKLLVRVSEFEKWMETYRVGGREELSGLVDEVMESLESD